MRSVGIVCVCVCVCVCVYTCGFAYPVHIEVDEICGITRNTFGIYMYSTEMLLFHHFIRITV